MSQMDLAAGNMAGRVSQGRGATVSVEAMQFLRPVKVADEVTLYATLIGVGRTSMRIHVDAWARPRYSEKAEKVTDADFVFVALDENAMADENTDFVMEPVTGDAEQLKLAIDHAMVSLLDDDIVDELVGEEKEELLRGYRKILESDPDLLTSGEYTRVQIVDGVPPRIILGKTSSTKGYVYPTSVRIFRLNGTQGNDTTASLWATDSYGINHPVLRGKNFTYYDGDPKIRGNGLKSTRLKLGEWSNDNCLVFYRVGRRHR